MENTAEFVGLQQNYYGEPAESITTYTLDLPEIKSDEVLVELVVAPLNPHDLIPIRKGPPVIKGLENMMPPTQFPIKLGGEGIARVLKTGSAVTTVTVGDIVDIPGGVNSWAERMVYSAEKLKPLPKANPVQLSFYRLNPIMAYVMLTEYTDLEEGSWVIQNAANSSIGQYVIQFAKRLGLRTLNIVRREALVEELKAIGADEVIIDSDDLPARIAELGFTDIKLGLDTLGDDATNKLGAIVAPGATIISYGSAATDDYNIKMNRVLFFLKQINLVNFYMGNWNRSQPREKIDNLLDDIKQLIANGELKTKIAGIFPLREYAAGLQTALDGKDGKVVFVGPGYEPHT